MNDVKWLDARKIKEQVQCLPERIISFESWWNLKIVLPGKFKEGVDYKVEDGKHYITTEADEQLRQDEIAGVMGASAERYERHRVDQKFGKQQTHADTGDPFWQEIVEGRV